jgi:hypothetical protein
MQGGLEMHIKKTIRFKAFHVTRAALTRRTRFSMRCSRVIKRKDKSSAAEGEALQEYMNQ